MRSAYRNLCYLIAADVVLQATFIAWGVFGLSKWVTDDGGVLDKQVLDDHSHFHFTAERGFMLHGINGSLVIPLLALALLVVAFLAKLPGGVAWAGAVLGLVILQAYVLAELGGEVPAIGALHGLNALLLLGVAVRAGQRVGTLTEATVPAV